MQPDPKWERTRVLRQAAPWIILTLGLLLCCCSLIGNVMIN